MKVTAALTAGLKSAPGSTMASNWISISLMVWSKLISLVNITITQIYEHGSKIKLVLARISRWNICPHDIHILSLINMQENPILWVALRTFSADGVQSELITRENVSSIGHV